MENLLVALLTALPILLGMAVGIRIGGGRTLSWLSKLCLAWVSGASVAIYGIRHQWHHPWGLITPLIAGLLFAILLRILLVQFSVRRRKIKQGRRMAQVGLLNQTVGATLGASVGFVLAVFGWQVALVSSTASPPRSFLLNPDNATLLSRANEQNSLASLAELAYSGFIRHLPVAGSLAEEIAAVKTIWCTPYAVRKSFTEYKGWDRLADLPSFRLIINDESIFSDIDSAANGNIAALYRLQKHPHIVKFYQEDSLKAITTELNASQVANELAEFQESNWSEQPSFPLNTDPVQRSE